MAKINMSLLEIKTVLEEMFELHKFSSSPTSEHHAKRAVINPHGLLREVHHLLKGSYGNDRLVDMRDFVGTVEEFYRSVIGQISADESNSLRCIAMTYQQFEEIRKKRQSVMNEPYDYQGSKYCGLDVLICQRIA